MAIEIKRTPVLKDDAAEAFHTAIQENKKKVSRERVLAAVEKSKKILATLKSGEAR